MMAPHRLDLSNKSLTCVLDLRRGVSLREFGLAGGRSWAPAGDAGRDFAVYAEGRRIDGGSDGLVSLGVSRHDEPSGAVRHTVKLLYEPLGLEIDSHHILYEDTAVWEKGLTLRNAGPDPIAIGRVDSFDLRLAAEEWRVLPFRSDWGSEFEPEETPLRGSLTLETRQGRSSKGRHPWMTLARGDGELLTVCPVWSGNWVLRCEQAEDGTFAVSGGLHDWQFAKTLQPGESFESVRVVLALGSGGDLNTISVPLARVGRKFWYPNNELSRSLPVEWNHWWSYEDKRINEAAFLANAEEAARMGIEVCTLDAGWFGPSEEGTDWYDFRGDWERVNERRFPGGIRALSDAVHERGMKFGLWCEIEAAGVRARLAEEHPGYVARRDGESLGYLCFGNPDVREWAFRTLDRLIQDYRCDWIKLDFNLDPQAGCNRCDHGHGPGDGLYEHYVGYYDLLDRVRAAHPHVMLENCASGGLRIDLGMLRHTHTTFLSDPDWPEHSLQVFWGATAMLAPDVCLHWSYSDWLGSHPRQRFDPRDPALRPHQFDYYARISMLGGFGFSQKLPELPDWMRERMAGHIRDYRTVVRRFVREADMYRLTGQPLREGRGDRWAAFQYGMPDGEEHLLFVFRLDGGEPERRILLKRINPDSHYELVWLSEEQSRVLPGSELAERGLKFDHLAEEDSALIRIRRLRGQSSQCSFSSSLPESNPNTGVRR